jgi:osmoprotectant transport system permease protein
VSPAWRIGLLLLFAAALARGETEALRVASKTFTESYILGEIAAQLLEENGYTVERQMGLGGSMVAFSALAEGEIDLSPDYTGTLSQVILDDPSLAGEPLWQALAQRGMQKVAYLGFNNSYAIAIPQRLAEARDITRISDLADHPELRGAFSHEFLERADGWPNLSALYGLQQEVAGVEHALAYGALERGDADLMDAYTTDGELIGRDLVLLEDDRGFFPQYLAVLVARQDLPEGAASVLRGLAGRLNERRMRELNYAVAIEKETPAAVAGEFLRAEGLTASADVDEAGLAERVLRHTLTHLQLTAIALALACLVAIPSALLLSRHERPARLLLYVTGLLQTIPSLALLALLIPLLGLGALPAIVALFLYSLLPIVRNTLTGLFSVDPLLRQVATGMGLTSRQRLLRIELPIAMPTILAGVKTAAIVSIGTATLAAFVGAGGLGEPIITGLNLNNTGLILEGALPAALLAIVTELLFDWLERSLIPAHLRPGLRA